MAMTLDEHKEIIKGLRETIKKIFESGGEISPTIYAVKNDSVNVFVVPVMPDDNSKDQVGKLMVSLVDKGAEGIGFVAESWMLDPNFIHTVKDYPSVSENPHRIEVIMFSYSTINWESMMMAKIIREEPEDPWGISFTGEEKKPKLAEWDINEGSEYHSQGRFCQLWKKARTLHYAEN